MNEVTVSRTRGSLPATGVNAHHGKTAAIVLACLQLVACDVLNGQLRKDPFTFARTSREVPDRIETIKQHETSIQQMLTLAEAALAAGDLDASQQYLKQLDALDPGNLRAIEGQRKIALWRQHGDLLQQARHILVDPNRDENSALPLLRTILIENPEHAEAQSLYKELLARDESKKQESLRRHLAYKAPVTLEFRDVSLKVIIESLAKGTGVNFILDKDVRSDQKATLFVKNTGLEEAISLLAQSNQLQKKIINDNAVILYPNVPGKQREYQDLVIRSFYLEHADPKTVAGLLRTMLGIRQVQVDERLPMIMIKDVPEIIPLAEKLIASQDVADPEVMLEMEVLEVKRSRNLDTGIGWPTQLSVIGDGLTVDRLNATRLRDLGVSPNPSIVFRGKDADANLLANPRIRVKNRDKAKIHIGDRVPIITSNVAPTGVISENVQYIDAGLKLEVEPVISLGGDVSIKVNLNVGSIGNSTKTNSGSVLYQIGTRSASTQLRIKDGQTQVLAGLINDEDRKNLSKLPGFGDIPLLGRLFSSHGDEMTKTEIILSITPRIVRESRPAEAAVSEYWVGSDTQAGRRQAEPISIEGLTKAFSAPPPAAPPPQLSVPLSGAVRSAPAKPEGINLTLPSGLSSPGPGLRSGSPLE